MGRISGFKNFRVLGYATVSVTNAGVDLTNTSKPSGTDGAFITITSNAASTQGRPVVKYTVPLQPTPGTSSAAPDPSTGTPVWNGGIIGLWPGQVKARLISLDANAQTASITWVALN
jgi:hypothetical protein